MGSPVTDVPKSTPGHGGKRPGAGRPPGSGRKPKAEQNDAYTILAKAKAKRETHLAQIAELDYKQRVGELVSASDVTMRWSNHINEAKIALLALPAKLAAELAPISDPAKISEIVRDRVYEILESLARGND
jgi:hypothetical protein